MINDVSVWVLIASMIIIAIALGYCKNDSDDGAFSI